MVHEGNGRNGNWRTWILGIVAAFVVVGIVSSISLSISVSTSLSRHEAEITNLKEVLRERTIGRYTREDADRDKMDLRLMIKNNTDDIARINNLATQRGVTIPRLEDDLRRFGERLDKLERSSR